MLSEDDSANNALAWLETDGLLVQFGTRRARAVAAYEHFVQDGIGGDSIWHNLNRQVFSRRRRLHCALAQAAALRPDEINISRAQRRPLAPSMKAIARTH